MTTRIVFNLAEDTEVTFDADMPAKLAVHICAAYERSMATHISLLIQADDLARIDKDFPVTVGTRSVACGDWATKL